MESVRQRSPQQIRQLNNKPQSSRHHALRHHRHIPVDEPRAQLVPLRIAQKIQDPITGQPVQARRHQLSRVHSRGPLHARVQREGRSNRGRLRNLGRHKSWRLWPRDQSQKETGSELFRVKMGA